MKTNISNSLRMAVFSETGGHVLSPETIQNKSELLSSFKKILVKAETSGFLNKIKQPDTSFLVGIGVGRASGKVYAVALSVAKDAYDVWDLEAVAENLDIVMEKDGAVSSISALFAKNEEAFVKKGFYETVLTPANGVRKIALTDDANADVRKDFYTKTTTFQIENNGDSNSRASAVVDHLNRVNTSSFLFKPGCAFVARLSSTGDVAVGFADVTANDSNKKSAYTSAYEAALDLAGSLELPGHIILEVRGYVEENHEISGANIISKMDSDSLKIVNLHRIRKT